MEGECVMSVQDDCGVDGMKGNNQVWFGLLCYLTATVSRLTSISHDASMVQHSIRRPLQYQAFDILVHFGSAYSDDQSYCMVGSECYSSS